MVDTRGGTGTDRRSGCTDPLGDLVLASHLATMEQLPSVVAEHAARAGMSEVLIYLSDVQQRSCFLLSEHGPQPGAVGEGEGEGEDEGEPAELSLEGTVPGRAFQRGEVLPATPAVGERTRWWVPLLDGAERLGVLRVTTPATAEPDTHRMRVLAGLVALLVVSKRGMSDFHARLVRRRQMNVAAELQWRLMQSQTFATERMVVSAAMEPAYEVSGDAFDYGLAGDLAYLSVFDGMGHDTAAGLTANLVVASCRNSWRQGLGLVETARVAERLLLEQTDGSRYVTAILASLDLAHGELSWVSCGHQVPILIRGGRTISMLECPPGVPIGTGLHLPLTVCRHQLKPGDRLVLYTDGITEARRPGSDEFGVDRLTEFLILHQADDLPVPETLRRLIHHHLQYHQGRLSDDATVLLMEWNGPHPFPPGEAEDLIGLPDQEPAVRPVSGAD
ncbi:PP2C family protein-serine/threonine phosphatase [Streptomyces litchfieldiae]|uniref:PP2C family protein-serine/threonine phosphatase n=1 Tax=Streptomyces litchfieldiae TaxID=3075543 RepID=A0ABU2MIL3_9ACTN|nr:PP2C family protein-serine/threonine phosphatase [Streptomyces sp. DSM 44938]MDT0341310.1 PP2C family protein-serine/threonine phosphatase [Streptomyces sp. DSM 44938]